MCNSIICLTQGRGSQRYANISPTVSAQNECFLSPHCTQSCWTSSELSHQEHNCPMYTRFGNVHCSCIRAPGILRSLEYLQYSIAGWHHVLQWYHIPEISCLSVSLTCFTIPFATFVNVSLCDGTVAQLAISLTLKGGLLFPCFLLRLSEQFWLLNCLLNSAHVIPTLADSQGGLARQSLQVWSQVCVASRRHPLLQDLHTYRLTIAAIKILIM